MTELISIDINKKALIIGFSHPYNAIRMMADSIAPALSLNGYQTHVAIIGEDRFLKELEIVSDKNLELIVCLGSPPLEILINSKRIWDFSEKKIQIITLVLDSLPYDLRMPGFVEYITQYKDAPHLSLVAFEGNIAETLARLTGKKVVHMHHGAYCIPISKKEKKYGTRLMFWGSIEAELGKTEITHDLIETLRRFNPWGLDENNIHSVVERIKETTDFYGFTDLAAALNIDHRDILRAEWINGLMAIDSAIKRYRRKFVMDSLADYPIDIYGKNWDNYVSHSSNLRIMSTLPDDNRAFPYACQEYGGLINIDPNWGNGTNERAITALSLGINIATNKNKMVEAIDGCYQYDLSGDSIRSACDSALANPNSRRILNEFSWQHVVTKMLREI